MTQKFKRGSRVRIADKMPSSMSHFHCGVEAIVEYTPGQKSKRDRQYQRDDFSNYSLLLFDKEGGIFGTVSWYPESVLTLVSDDTREGLNILEQYHFPN